MTMHVPLLDLMPWENPQRRMLFAPGYIGAWKKRIAVALTDFKGRSRRQCLADLIRFRTAYYPGDERRIAPN